MTHILVDTANTFFRARHVIRGDTSEKVGMAIHIMMNSIKKAWQDFGGTHVIFCLEGRSWRKDHYAPYKRNRKEMADAMTEKEKEENMTHINDYNSSTIQNGYLCSICDPFLLLITEIFCIEIIHHYNNNIIYYKHTEIVNYTITIYSNNNHMW